MDTKKAVKTLDGLQISMSLEKLKSMGITVDLTNDNLYLNVSSEYDQEFTDFIDMLPRHLSNDEKARLISVIDETYTHLLVERCFKKAINNAGAWE